MPNPEINVRLTADGVQDVVNAFRRVQDEARKTKHDAGILNDAMKQLGSVMPMLSLGAAVGLIVSMGKGALESAINIGKLSEKVGASAGTLSVLTMAANDVGVSQEMMGTGLAKLAKNQQAAAEGTAVSKKAFTDLGISMKDVQSKNPADMFVEISQKLQSVPEGAQRTALAIKLIGKGGADLIPVMDEIGQNDGFTQAQKKAQDLGLYFSDDMVADARQAERAIKDMEDITKGFSMQFMSGLMPGATKAVTDVVTTVTGSGSDSIKKFGVFVGNVVRGIVNDFLVAGQTIAVVFESAFDGITVLIKTTLSEISQLSSGVGTATSLAMKGDFSGAWHALQAAQGDASKTAQSGSKELNSRQGAIWSSYGSMVKHEYGDAPAAPISKPTGGGDGGSGDGGAAAAAAKAEKEREKLIDARAAYEDAVDATELQKQKDRNQLQEAQDKARYDAGIDSLNTYYAARADRINSEADAEEGILSARLANEEDAAAKLMNKSKGFIDDLIKQGPAAVEAAAGTNTAALAMLQHVAQTRAQIDEDEIKRQTQLQQNDTQRQDAQKRADAQYLTDRERLYTLEGMTSSAQDVALEKELQETDDLLKKLGKSEEERARILAQVSANAGAKNQMASLTQHGSNAMESLNVATADIQDKAAAGAISQVDAEAQIYNLEKQRLPVLQGIADKMQEVVDNNQLQLLSLTPGTEAYDAQAAVVDTLQKAVDQYSKGVNRLGESLKTTKTFSVELSNQLVTQGYGAAVNFFDAVETGSKGFESAFADMGATFEKVIVHMIDQMIVYYSLMALLGWINPAAGSSLGKLQTSMSSKGAFGFAGGGYTGDAATNKPVGVVHGQEYVFDASTTAMYGKPFLDAMAAGKVGFVASGTTYSSASQVAASTAGQGENESNPLVEINVENATGQPVTTTTQKGAGGQSVIDIVVGKVAANIAGGGSVGQAIQSTYGVTRKGIIRG